jgi:hypothetical protein
MWAKMAARPEEYRWSSYRGYVFARRAVPWIVYDKVLGEFGRDLSTARRAYGRFVRAGVDEPPPSPFGKAIGGLLLGSEKFVRRIQRLIDARPADAQQFPERRKTRQKGGTWTVGFVEFGGEHLVVQASDSAIMVARTTDEPTLLGERTRRDCFTSCLPGFSEST